MIGTKAITQAHIFISYYAIAVHSMATLCHWMPYYVL